jgi:signal transduction histidine kinase
MEAGLSDRRAIQPGIKNPIIQRASRSIARSAIGLSVFFACSDWPFDRDRSLASAQNYPQGYQTGQCPGELRHRPVLVEGVWYRFAAFTRTPVCRTSRVCRRETRLHGTRADRTDESFHRFPERSLLARRLALRDADRESSLHGFRSHGMGALPHCKAANTAPGAVEECPEAREAIRRIMRDGNRAADVVSRMRALFKKACTTRERLDINQSIEEVVVLTQSEVRRNRVALRLDLAANLPPVMGDRVQIQQVVVNLILNAIEAMSTVEDRERNLVISTHRGEGDEVRVVVLDSGIGFDRLSAERIFDAFHTTKPGGLGMGLSISRSIAESHGGRLWAVANDGPGATFQFTLLKSQ